MKFLRRGRMRYGLLLVLFLFSYQCQAQEVTPQRYENHRSVASNNITPDTATINRILRSADILRNSYRDSFRYLSALALKQSRTIKYRAGIYDGLNKLGLYFRDRGLHDSAISFFEQAIPYAKSVQGKNKVYILYNNIGNSYSDMGKYEWALESFYHSLEATGKSNASVKSEDSVAIYINIGILWGKLKEKENGLHSFIIAERLAERIKDTNRLVLTYVNLGILYHTTGELGKAEDYYKKGLLLAREHGLTGYQIYALTSLAQLYVKWNMPENALAHIQEALHLLKVYPATADMWLNVQSTLGAIYLNIKDYEKAKPFLLAALKIAEDGNLRGSITQIEPDVATAYAALGAYKEAYEHMQHYALLKDTVFEQEKTRSLQVWMQSRINEKDKAMLAQRLNITQQRNELQAKNFWIIGTVCGALLLLAMAFALVKSYRHKQGLQQSTIYRMQQEQEINQLKAQVRGEEQERNRIAQELHDGIASQLWAIKLNVDSLRQQRSLNESQQQNLGAIYQQLEETTQDVRKTAHNLMPDLLLEEGLATAVASLCEKTAKSTGLEVDFQEYGTIPRMNEEIELSLYRMIQELIQNVLKHAEGVSQLLVQLSCTDTLLNITVEDNGKGFSEEDRNEGKGVGLTQIQKRVKAMQGHIDLQSTKGKGTTLYLEFDIQHLL